MKEFEFRFKVDDENILNKEIKKLGFKKDSSYEMSDLIFENKEWVPGTGLRPGYFIFRIRLKTDQKPVLEFK